MELLGAWWCRMLKSASTPRTRLQPTRRTPPPTVRVLATTVLPLTLPHTARLNVWLCVAVCDIGAGEPPPPLSVLRERLDQAHDVLQQRRDSVLSNLQALREVLASGRLLAVETDEQTSIEQRLAVTEWTRDVDGVLGVFRAYHSAAGRNADDNDNDQDDADHDADDKDNEDDEDDEEGSSAVLPPVDPSLPPLVRLQRCEQLLDTGIELQGQRGDASTLAEVMEEREVGAFLALVASLRKMVKKAKLVADRVRKWCVPVACGGSSQRVVWRDVQCCAPGVCAGRRLRTQCA